jgi:hypothetical protein
MGSGPLVQKAAREDKRGMPKDQDDDKGKEKDTEKQKGEKSITLWNWYFLNGRGPPPTFSSLRRTVQKHIDRDQLDQKAAKSFEKEKESAFKEVEGKYGTRNAGLFGGLTSSKPNKKEIRRLYKEKKGEREKRRERKKQTKEKTETGETGDAEKRQEYHVHLADEVTESEEGDGKDANVMMSGASGREEREVARGPSKDGTTNDQGRNAEGGAAEGDPVRDDGAGSKTIERAADTEGNAAIDIAGIPDRDARAS